MPPLRRGWMVPRILDEPVVYLPFNHWDHWFTQSFCTSNIGRVFYDVKRSCYKFYSWIRCHSPVWDEKRASTGIEESTSQSCEMPSWRQSSAMLSSPRSPARTIRIFSSEEYRTRVLLRMSLMLRSAASWWRPVLCLIVHSMMVPMSQKHSLMQSP